MYISAETRSTRHFDVSEKNNVYINGCMFYSFFMHEIIHSDCLEAMKAMADNSLDFCVTDPPYGLKFMGKKWDYNVPSLNCWKELLRILKPGAMIAVFAGSRTYHRMVINIEDAGFEIRDCIMWIYGGGFPKSHNHFGFEGYGTALKPAYEPICLAMKPLDGTFAQNAKKWGVAGINVHESRIETFGNRPTGLNKDGTRSQKTRNEGWDRPWKHKIQRIEPNASKTTTLGRWPANVIFDEEAAQELDRQSGFTKSKKNKSNDNRYNGNLWEKGNCTPENSHNDSGGASRFFYCAKASSSERNEGLDGMPLKETGVKNDSGRGFSETDPYAKIMAQNHHPTVKPLALMRYIIKLLASPSKPKLIDPFAGSGTTIIAAKELGISAIGIEKEAEYVEIARKRIESARWIPEQFELPLTK